MAKRKRPPAPQPTSESASINTPGTPNPPSQQQASPQSPPRWIPSEETRVFEVSINAGEPCLIVRYDPHELIKELRQLFSLMYLDFDVPLSLLVKPGSPIAGVLTAWLAIGAAQAVGNSAKNKRGRASEEEINSLLKSIADGVYDRIPTEETLGRLNKFAQGGNEEISRVAYGVGRWTTLAADYVAQHLHEKIQSALIQLALESQAHAIKASLEAQGQEGNIRSEQGLVDTILGTEEKLIKARLRTRRPGGSTSKHDFSPLPVFYEQGKKHFSKAKRVLRALGDSSRQEQRQVIGDACREIDSDLIDRLIDKQRYHSSLSHLAVEWAARRCGLRADRGDDEYKTEYLLQVLSQERRKKK